MNCRPIFKKTEVMYELQRQMSAKKPRNERFRAFSSKNSEVMYELPKQFIHHFLLLI